MVFVTLIVNLFILFNIIKGECPDTASKQAVVNKIFDVAVDPYINGIKNSDGAIYNKLLNQAVSFVSNSADIEELKTLIGCIRSNYASCTVGSSQSRFVLNTAYKIRDDPTYVTRILNVANTIKALNLNSITNPTLTKTLGTIDSIVETDCFDPSHLKDDMYVAKTLTKSTDKKKVLSVINKLNNLDNYRRLQTAQDLLAITAVTDILKLLGLSDFTDEILAILALPDFAQTLIDLGSALSTGVGLVDAIDGLLNTLLSRNFFLNLASALNITDLTSALAALLEAVLDLVVEVLELVRQLLPVVDNLLAELIEALEGICLLGC